MTFTAIFQMLGPILLQTTLVLAVGSLIALSVLRLSGCRRPWVHQFVWGAVLLLGLVGMRIPFVVPVEVESPNEAVSLVPTEIEQEASVAEQVASKFAEIDTTPFVREPSDAGPVEFVSIGKESTSFAGENSFLPARPIERSSEADPEFVAKTEPSPFGMDRTTILRNVGPAFFALWAVVFLGLLLLSCVRYGRLLLSLSRAETPDAETQRLWTDLFTRQGIAARKRPTIKILPEGGPALVRTLRGHVLVLSKSHWSELDADLRSGMMRHELAHFLYGDLWKTLFARLVVLLHWFNPAARLAARRFEEALEWSADSFSYGSDEKGIEQFAAAMLTLHETTPENYRYRVAFGTKDILRRLEFLKRLKNGSKESLLKTGLLLGLSAILLALGAINVRIVAQEKKEEAKSNVIKTAEKSEPAKTTDPVPMALTVLDADGKPIAGARGHASRVDRDNKRPGRNFKTDENGIALIERTVPENASWACFNVKTPGYTPYFAVWERDKEPEYPPDSFTVKLDKAKTVGGIVHDPEGKPVKDVSVEFSFPYGKHSFNDESTYCAASGKTDAEGRWTCGYVPRDVFGNTRFYLRHPDFQSTQIEVDLDGLGPNAEGRYSHVFTVLRGYEVNGTVKDEHGSPIAGARVEVQFFGIPGSAKDMYKRTATDAEGRYRFTTCPMTDSAAVVAQAPGFAGRFVETMIGTEPKTVDIVLGPSKPLKLRIVDEQGDPVKDPEVSVNRWGPFDGESIAPPVTRMLKAENYEPLKLDDGNGNWAWNDALAGKFRVAVRAEGFMMQKNIEAEAGDATKEIVMKPWLKVTGTVVDDETGETVPGFRLVEGLGNIANDIVSWQTHGIRKEKGGSFHYIADRPERFGRRLRIEADGYENADSRLIENDEGSIELTFRMKRAAPKASEPGTKTGPLRTGVVIAPNGKPAVDARILVFISPTDIYVTLDNLDHHLQASTDRKGEFTLPSVKFEDRQDRERGRENRFALVLVHEDGCRYLSGEDFDRNYNTASGTEAEPITLEQWGELKGTLSIGDRPGEGARLNANRRNSDSDPRFDFSSETVTGKGGIFSFNKLFPGAYSVSRNIVTQRSDNSTSWTVAISRGVSISSGKNAGITLGGTGRPVIGHVNYPDGFKERLEAGNQYVTVHPHVPPEPEKLQELFKELRENVEKIHKEQPNRVITYGRNGDFGREAFALRDEYVEKVQRLVANSFGARIDTEGNFRVEDVESGDWVLKISAFDIDKKLQIRFEHPFTVPDMPGGRSDEPLDLGAIRVEEISTRPPTVKTSEQPAMVLTVLDAREKPIAGAAVEFVTFPRVKMEVLAGTLLGSKGRIHRVKTDENGRLGIRLPEETPKSVSYSINIDRYGPAWLRWENIEKPEDLPGDFTVRLEDAQTVGGILVDEEGEPIEGAVVDARVRPTQRPEDTKSVGGGGSCTTDERGRWIFRSIPRSCRDLPLEIKHTEFMPLRPTIATATYLIEEGNEPDKALILPRGRRVTGTIMDSDGKPIDGAMIQTYFMNDIRKTRSDEKGQFHLTGVPVGELNLTVTSTGKAPEFRRMEIVPEMPQEIPDIDFRLQSGGIVRLTIVDREGKPCSNASVSFGDWLGEFRFLAYSAPKSKSDDQGRWTWNESPRREFTIDVYLAGKRTTRMKITPREEPYTLVMQEPLEVTGVVTDEETGKPIENYVLVPAWISPGSYYSDGKYTGDILNWVRSRSQNVTSSEYRFTTTENTTKAYRIRIEAPGYRAAESRDILSEEEQVRIDFKLKKGTPIESTVFLPGEEKAVAGHARVYLLDDKSQARVKTGKMELELSGTATETDENGRFTLPAWDKPFWLWILHENGFARVRPGELRPGQGIRLTAWSRVEGTVFKGSRPAANEKVFLSGFGNPEEYNQYDKGAPNFYMYYETVADENGHFLFDYVVPGAGTACRVIQDEMSQKTNRGGGRYTGFEPFEVEPGETATVRIGGRGRPVIGRLETTSEVIDWSRMILTSGYGKTNHPIGSSVGSDGRFRIEDVLPGKYELFLYDQGDMRVGRSFKVEFEVDAIPDGRTDESLDLGVLPVR